jgi:hypothetical protein
MSDYLQQIHRLARFGLQLIGIGTVGWAVLKGVQRRNRVPATRNVTGIGSLEEQTQFIKRHQTFLNKFPNLQKALDAIHNSEYM